MSLRVAGLINESLVDGPGIRFVLFAQGCPLRCPGCHNPEAADPRGGVEMSLAEILARIKGVRGIDGVTFSGGEPFYQAEPLARLGKEILRLGLNLVIYSGYTFAELLERGRREEGTARLLSCGWLLVEGSYREEERDLSLPFRGSRNQRILDLPSSLEQGAAIEWKQEER
ncbi:MAG: radical SAM protein [Firmicutes bacterium]|nr:radical SAM protein [Bacillota bacterium]